MKPCRYCQQPAVLAHFHNAAYPYRSDYGPVWTCTPCLAWVGCHPGTDKPLGGLANAELRAAKQAAHAAFDPIWHSKLQLSQCSKRKVRNASYAWLAIQLGLPTKQCHIGFMSLEECRKVVEVCSAVINKVTP